MKDVHSFSKKNCTAGSYVRDISQQTMFLNMDFFFTKYSIACPIKRSCLILLINFRSVTKKSSVRHMYRILSNEIQVNSHLLVLSCLRIELGIHRKVER